MARLTLQLGGPLVVPITAPRRFPLDWRIQSLMEAGLAATMRHRLRRDDARSVECSAIGAIASHRDHAIGAAR
jgi:hypothetical protein